MLVLTRRVGEAIIVGGEVRIVLVEMGTGQVRIGIEAPKQIEIMREEVYTGKEGWKDED